MSERETTGQSPLLGLRVLSLAEQYPGPYATLLLSDLGAEVIQVERPGEGDPSRRYEDFFSALNRGKRSVVLDLKRPEGVAALRRLAAEADVFFEGFRPGVVDRLGIGHEVLREDNPRLVYVSISGFGQGGPLRDRPAHDMSFQAMAGLLEISAGEDRIPHISLADLIAGMFGAIAALTGLSSRALTDRGGYYDVAMYDGLLALLISRLVPLANGAPEMELGRDPGMGVFLTADELELTLSVSFEDHFWRRLCEVAGLEDYAGIGVEERVARREELRPLVAAAIAGRSRAEWVAILDAAGVPFGPVLSGSEILESDHVVARGLLSTVDGRRYMRQPLIVDGVGWGPRAGVPAPGEATAEILAAIGLDGAAVTRASGG